MTNLTEPTPAGKVAFATGSAQAAQRAIAALTGL
jgi:hypothetical protein